MTLSCCAFLRFPSGFFKLLLIQLGLGVNAAAQAQVPAAPAARAAPETSAVWLARVRRLPFSAQVPELRARLQADARRTFRNDPS